MSGNICRCGTYQRMRQAIHRAAQLFTARTMSGKEERMTLLAPHMVQKSRQRETRDESQHQTYGSPPFSQDQRCGSGRTWVGFQLPGPFASSRRMKSRLALRAQRLDPRRRRRSDHDLHRQIGDGPGHPDRTAMIAAEELECDWKKVRTEFAPAEKEYVNPWFGVQGTGASSATRTSWDPLRKAGAAARMMLIEAAAQKWGVDTRNASRKTVSSFTRPLGVARVMAAWRLLRRSFLFPRTYRSRTRSSFASWASRQAAGHARQSEWRAEYGIDVRLPGMLYAVVARCPVFGGKVASFDATKAKAVPGVKNVIEISSGVAVVADNTWTAMEGRRALVVKWDEGPNANVSSDSISKLFAERAAQPGVCRAKRRRRRKRPSGAAKKIEAVYEVPFLAHATMEPQNCTADVRADRCDVWAPTQAQTNSQNTAAKNAGLKPEAVFIHTTFLGGGFGRRFEADLRRGGGGNIEGCWGAGQSNMVAGRRHAA